MANRTVKDAKSVRGTNPQYLVEKIIRSRVYDSKYWKEECFALSAELVVDKAMDIRFVGGVYGGNIKPTPFLCLTLKMLQIQPEKDIIVEFIKNEEFKYVRALGAFYMRLVGSSLDCYKYLEPLFNDGRKLRRQNRQGTFELIHMDEFIDELLREERVCDIILPRIQKRYILEESSEIQPKISALEDDLDEGLESSGEEEGYLSDKSEPYYDDRFKKRPDDRIRPLMRKSPDRDRKEKDRKYRERERYMESNRSRDNRRHRSKSPVRYRDEDRRKDEEREFERRRSPVRNRSPERERVKDREKKYKDKEKDKVRERDRHKERSRSKERRHRSKSPQVRHRDLKKKQM